MPRDDDLSLDLDPDCSPWIGSPSSSRVSRYRYDHANRATQVQWRNEIGDGYVYGEMNYEQYRQFARAVSKGEKVNTFLNAFNYRPMTTSEWSAVSNENRRGLTSRTGGA